MAERTDQCALHIDKPGADSRHHRGMDTVKLPRRTVAINCKKCKRERGEIGRCSESSNWKAEKLSVLARQYLLTALDEAARNWFRREVVDREVCSIGQAEKRQKYGDDLQVAAHIIEN